MLLQAMQRKVNTRSGTKFNPKLTLIGLSGTEASSFTCATNGSVPQNICFSRELILGTFFYSS